MTYADKQRTTDQGRYGRDGVRRVATVRRWASPRICLTFQALLLLFGVGIDRNPAIAASDPLAGRLGGTLRSFEERYGPSQPSTGDIGQRYDVAGFGLVAINFDASGTYDPENPARLITLMATRTPESAATEPDPGDWSLDQARQQALNFLPRDVVLETARLVGDHALMSACRSAALAAAFGTAATETAACRVDFVTPTATTVSYIVLSLADAAPADPAATPVDPCAGLSAWARATGQRLAEAETVLDDISALATDDPNATEILTTAADRFTTLAAAQREESVPSVAATANYHLIGALTSYADALADAASALRSGDAPGVATAVDQLTAAAGGIRRGNAAMTTAFTDCGLTPATPTVS